MWIERWGQTIAEQPTRPGIWRLKAGGYLIVTQVTARDGKRKTGQRKLPAASLDAAQRAREDLREELRRELTDSGRSKQLFATFAARLFERKVESRAIKSAKGRLKWDQILRSHLLPAFGSFAVDELRHSHVVEWRDARARDVVAGTLSPRTVNTWLSVLASITATMTAELELDRDPSLKVSRLDTSERPTYTDERPNALSADEARAFMGKMLELHPRHYAMTALGFATGLRPSSLRALRRSGPEVDLEWDTGKLRVRRSHTRGQEVMRTTKTGHASVLYLPPELVAILREHVALCHARTRTRESIYLFPSFRGGMRSPSALDKPFAACSKAIGVEVTSRAMRRTFNDLCRAAEVHDVVTRSISGHLTEAMQGHYSTAAADEQRAAIGKVVRLFG